MKKEKVGITILILFITITTSINILSLNKTSKLLGSSIGDIKYTDYLKSENVTYSSTNVQNAIDEIYASASESFLDRMYPIGSIYISTSLSTASKVHDALGGTWESYGSGRTLVGIGNNGTTNYTIVGATGGSESQSYTPAGKNTGGAVGNHTLTLSEIPDHSHKLPLLGQGTTTIGRQYNMSWTDNSKGNFDSEMYTSRVGGSGAHNHPFTQPTFTGTQATISHMQPYITVYMYKRIK